MDVRRSRRGAERAGPGRGGDPPAHTGQRRDIHARPHDHLGGTDGAVVDPRAVGRGDGRSLGAAPRGIGQHPAGTGECGQVRGRPGPGGGHPDAADGHGRGGGRNHHQTHHEQPQRGGSPVVRDGCATRAASVRFARSGALPQATRWTGSRSGPRHVRCGGGPRGRVQ
ncbi:hypothetical protein GCM10010124_11610 [Pilimelia terevasa]|uniref:Uncharacterized protein n=1 Tax=Pilimelia terevasa TaxID=53372 RepID=A0A8J3BQM0_9ACTN|nr:hypothetical protein GCM10010124_11610 [Pilimelia terevasa]